MLDVKPLTIDECVLKMREYGEPVLLCEVGSTAHGTGLPGSDDLDLMGIVVPNIEDTLGLSEFEHYIYRTAFERTGNANAKSEPGDVDLTIYSLRKFVRLAKKGNPSILNVLYGPAHFLSPEGERLRFSAPLFVSKEAGKRFLGYMFSQRARLAGERGQKGVNRPELVEQYGFDTKYAYHIIRLGLQGLEYIKTGKISVPLNETYRDLLLGIRTGQYKLETVLGWADELETDLRAAIESSHLPDSAPTPAINQLLVSLHCSAWPDIFRRGNFAHCAIEGK